MRPTDRLAELQTHARSRDDALNPSDLGASRATRHSFARSMLRVAAAEQWCVTRERFDLDDDGRGTVTYVVERTGAPDIRLVAFPTVVDESQRTDRVVAEAWDLTAALCTGPVDDARVEALRRGVTRQEGGRASTGTLVWTRANRSARFFDHVVERLANGVQPDPVVIGDDAYVMRSTAFYANGKWGLTDFDGVDDDDPLGVPYRAQMLTAWLVRELSLDIVEHCAARRRPGAASLDPEWRRYFGLGNATGLGMVPYVINHPVVLDAWVAARELPLAHALASTWEHDSLEAGRVVLLLERAVQHFSERRTLATHPYASGPDIAAALAPIVAAAREWVDTGSASAAAGMSLARTLHACGASAGVEVRAIVDSILVDVDDRLDGDIESLLWCDESCRTDLSITCGELLHMFEGSYGWVESFDFDDPDESARFWYLSASSQEPRRGRRGVDSGDDVEHAIDTARRVRALATELRDQPADRTAADLLCDHPALLWAVERVVTGHRLVFGEAHVNPLGEQFLPLDLQRFQLAMYGMENFSPQSTDWLRVTLFAGAPRASDVASGVADVWWFVNKPGGPLS